MRSMVGSHQKLTATNWKPSSKLILLQLHKKLPKTSMSSFLQSFSVWCNWKGEKARLSGSWADQKLEKKKNHCFEVSSSLILHNNEPFLNQIVTCNETWILYNWQQWLNQKAPKLLPKPNLVVCCQSDPLQLSESGQNHYLWEVCSTNQWDATKTARPAARIGQQKGPNSPWQGLTAYLTANASKAEELIGLQRLASSAILTCPHKPTTTSSSISTFSPGKHFHNQQDAENAF